jgi:AcrR family transcriptional regulator
MEAAVTEKAVTEKAVTERSRTAAPPSTVEGDPPARSPRERLLASANELFYAEGVQSVGIDRIIEHAGVAKASLYNLFGSKEGLVLAYLWARHDGTSAGIAAVVDRHRNPRRRLLAVFDNQAQVFAQPGLRGCAFVAAFAEAPLGGLVAQSASEYRTWMRALFVDLAEQAGATDPPELARQLQIVFDGGMIAAWMDRDPSIATSSRAAVEALLDAASCP